MARGGSQAISSDDPETLGQYIRRVRKSRGMTQEELAQLVGITKAYICIIERGQLTGRDVAVSPAKLEAIAKALHVHAEEIFNRARILPQGTVLIRHADESPTGSSGGRDGGGHGVLPLESIRDWDELCAAGYAELPQSVRDEIKRFIEFRARQLRDDTVSSSSR